MSRREEYQRYLGSAEWKAHRDLALARTSGFCQFCGDVAAHVHHVRYPKRLGDEHPYSLVPVCQKCHDLAHGVFPMKTLSSAIQMTELSPFGGRLKYLFTGGRVYASAKSWSRALQMPDSLCVWFETGLSRVAMLKKDLAGGDLEMLYQNVLTYRWHAVADQLRAFDRNWYSHQYKSRSIVEQRELERFHDNYERLISWGYDLQERALSNALHEKKDPSARVTQEILLEALKRAVAPRLRAHDEKLHEHDIVIGEIIESAPTLRNQDEFISVKQAVNEQGFDPTQMPLYPQSSENLSGLTGRILKDRHAERGPSVLSRIDGQKLRMEINTYRRRDIYAALEEVFLHKQEGLRL